MAPHHPYTEARLSAAPALGRESGRRIRLDTAPVQASAAPEGCRFHGRCHISPSQLQDLQAAGATR